MEQKLKAWRGVAEGLSGRGHITKDDLDACDHIDNALEGGEKSLEKLSTRTFSLKTEGPSGPFYFVKF